MEQYRELRREALEVIEARKNWVKVRTNFHQKAAKIIDDIKDLDERKKVFEYLYGHEGDEEVDLVVEQHLKKRLNKPEMFG